MIADSQGVKIAYEIRGVGEPLTLVHGLAYDRNGWGRLPDLLAQRFRVALLDNRGVGESDEPEGPYAVAQMAADVVAVLDDAGIERTNLFGVSLGGYIAQELALAYPERLAKLVLASTAPGGGRRRPTRARRSTRMTGSARSRRRRSSCRAGPTTSSTRTTRSCSAS